MTTCNFSTLPELFAAHGVQTFVSARNVVRNPEIGELVWNLNPYVAGVSDEEPNAGSGAAIDRAPRNLEYIERIESAHGLNPTNKLPKIYYRPKPRPDLAEAILVDLGSISVQHRRRGLERYLSSVISNYGYDRSSIFQVQFKTTVGAGHKDHRFDFPSFVPADIFDYCDALASCKAFVTVHSGAQSLAVAVRGDAPSPTIHCYCAPIQFNERVFTFPRVEYHVSYVVPTREKIYRSILKRTPAVLHSIVAKLVT